MLDLAVHGHRPVLLIPVLSEPAGQRGGGGVLVATDASPGAREAERLGTELVALIGGGAITVLPAEESGDNALHHARRPVLLVPTPAP